MNRNYSKPASTPSVRSGAPRNNTNKRPAVSAGYQGHNPRPMTGGGFHGPKKSFGGSRPGSRPFSSSGSFGRPVRKSGNRGNGGGGRAFGAQNIHFSKFINNYINK